MDQHQQPVEHIAAEEICWLGTVVVVPYDTILKGAPSLRRAVQAIERRKNVLSLATGLDVSERTRVKCIGDEVRYHPNITETVRSSGANVTSRPQNAGKFARHMIDIYQMLERHVGNYDVECLVIKRKRLSSLMTI
jgi:hypothetical protein